MAKLSAHGREIGRIEYLAKQVAVFEDGHLLVNYGDGWKLHKKFKAGVDPAAGLERRRVEQAEFLAANPAFAEYRRLVHEAAPASKRFALTQAVELLGDDVDGLWSELQQSWGGAADLDLSLEDCEALARAYAAAGEEARARKAAQMHAATVLEAVGA